MDAVVRTIRLYGDLGKRYGRVHKYAVNSPAEAIRALTANFKGFDKYLVDAGQKNVGFQVVNGGSDLESADQVHEPASREIKIIPRVMGASAGARILLGAALIAVSFLAAPFIGPIGANFLFSAGASLVLGGVVEMLSPQPKIDAPQEDPENNPSYAFNGPVNTTAQGHPVPLCYGRLVVGGAVISASLDIIQNQGGTRRVAVTRTASINIRRWNQEQVFSIDPFPQNWTRREFVGTYSDGDGSDNTLIDVYTYYYDEWITVPV